MFKKLFLLGLLIVLVLVGLVVVFGGAALNKGIRALVVEYGPRLTGTPVALAEVDISPFDGRGSLSGFVIGNPPGYSTSEAMSFDTVEIKLVPSSLAGDHLVIERILIAAPKLTLEQMGGSSNLQDIQRQIAAFTGSGGESPPSTQPESEEPSSLKLEIQECVLSDITLTIKALGQDRTVVLPTIRLTNLGSAKGGVPPAEIAQEVMGAVMQAAAAKTQEIGLQVLRDPEGSLDQARSQLESLREGAAGALQGLLGGQKKKDEAPTGGQ